MALPSAPIEHQIPGRMRLRVPARRGDRAFFAMVEERLRAAPGVRRLHADPRTGGILILHDGDPGPALALAREQALFDATARAMAAAPPGRARQARNLPDPLAVAALGFAGLGFYQAARGRTLGNAVESFWQAYGLRTMRAQPWLSVGISGLAVYQLGAGRILGPASSLFLYALHAWRMARQGRHLGQGT
jgi:hypothetical protein